MRHFELHPMCTSGSRSELTFMSVSKEKLSRLLLYTNAVPAIFHVLEKLAAVAPVDKGHWLDKQRASLLNGKVEVVIESLKRQYDKKEEVTRLIGYMENHKHQMDYLTYRQNGWMKGCLS